MFDTLSNSHKVDKTMECYFFLLTSVLLHLCDGVRAMLGQ
jgi:hypothetical protein